MYPMQGLEGGAHIHPVKEAGLGRGGCAELAHSAPCPSHPSWSWDPPLYPNPTPLTPISQAVPGVMFQEGDIGCPMGKGAILTWVGDFGLALRSARGPSICEPFPRHANTVLGRPEPGRPRAGLDSPLTSSLHHSLHPLSHQFS